MKNLRCNSENEYDTYYAGADINSAVDDIASGAAPPAHVIPAVQLHVRPQLVQGLNAELQQRFFEDIGEGCWFWIHDFVVNLLNGWQIYMP